MSAGMSEGGRGRDELTDAATSRRWAGDGSMIYPWPVITHDNIGVSAIEKVAHDVTMGPGNGYRNRYGCTVLGLLSPKS